DADPLRRETARAPARAADGSHHADLSAARPARSPALPRPLPDRVWRAAALPRPLRRRRGAGAERRARAGQPGAQGDPDPDRQAPRMRNVLVTHADLPLGRRIVKVLWHDPGVDRIVAVGEGAVPRAFHPYRIGPSPRLSYERIDLVRQRSVSELFRSK